MSSPPQSIPAVSTNIHSLAVPKALRTRDRNSVEEINNGILLLAGSHVALSSLVQPHPLSGRQTWKINEFHFRAGIYATPIFLIHHAKSEKLLLLRSGLQF